MSILVVGLVPMLLALPLVQASLTGTVTDAGTAEPLVGVTVALPELDRAAATDSVGRYRLDDVPPGPHHVTVGRIGYAARALHAIVPRTGTLELDVALAPAPVTLRPVHVHAPPALRGLERTTAAWPEREVSRAAIANDPMLAEPDAFQALDGGEVTVIPESPGGVHVRGGASDQTAYALDGVPVLNPWHVAGLSSAWNPDGLARVRLWSTEPPPDASHALSGTIEGTTRPSGDRLRGQTTVSTSQARLTLDGPLGATGAGFLLGVRRGLHDLVAPHGEASYLGGAAGDWLAKLEAPLLGGRVRVLGTGNQNAFDATATAPEPYSPVRNRFDWHGRSLGAGWTRATPHALARVLGWSATADASARWHAPDGALGLTAARRDAGVTAGYERRAGDAITGVDLRLERIDTEYGVAADSAGGPAWHPAGTTTVATAAVRHDRALSRALQLALGASVAEMGGRAYPEPRIRLRWSADDHVAITATAFRTHQFVQSLRNPESVVGYVFPADLDLGAGVPGIPVARSDQAVLAAEWRPLAGARLGAQVYARDSDGLLLVAPATGGPFSTGAFAAGTGGAQGAAVDLAISGARYGVLAAWGWQQVRLHAPGADYVPEYGVAHTLETGLVVFPTATTTVQIGATAAIGRRGTAIPGAFEWESYNLLDRGAEFAGSPDYTGAATGGTRLPDYLRLDVGARQHWHLTVGGRDTEMALFGTVTNVLGWSNVLTWSHDPVTGAPVPVELRPMGALVVGFDGRF